MKGNRMSLLTVSTTAQRSGATESLVRELDKRGFVQASRDSQGRRLFSEADVVKIARYVTERPRRAA